MNGNVVQNSSNRGDLLTVTISWGSMSEDKTAFLRWRETDQHVALEEICIPSHDIGVKA